MTWLNFNLNFFLLLNIMSSSVIFYGTIIQASYALRTNFFDTIKCGHDLIFSSQAGLICFNSQTCYPE